MNREAKVSPKELTEFFRNIVSVTGYVLRRSEVGDETMWELSRAFHKVWRDAVERLQVSHSEEEAVTHPAMQELLRLIDAEVER